MTVKVFDIDNPGLRLPIISSDARFIVWLGEDSETANMNYVVLEPGEENIPHIHKESEDTIFILEGKGSIKNHDNGEVHYFGKNDLIHVPIGMKHAVRADCGEKIISVGGPSPADKHLLKNVGKLPKKYEF